MSDKGVIKQIIGAVIDVEFDKIKSQIFMMHWLLMKTT